MHTVHMTEIGTCISERENEMKKKCYKNQQHHCEVAGEHTGYHHCNKSLHLTKLSTAKSGHCTDKASREYSGITESDGGNFSFILDCT